MLRYDTISLPILSDFKFGTDAAKVVLFIGPSLDLASDYVGYSEWRVLSCDAKFIRH